MSDQLCACRGTGWIETVENRKITRPSPDGPDQILTIAVPVVIPCPRCHGDKGNDPASIGIPERFQHATLSNFEVMNDPMLNKARRICSDYVEKFGTPRDQNSILLMGPPGVGKTHLAASIVRQVQQNMGISTRFIDFRDILSIIRTSYQDEGYWSDEKVFNQFMTIDLLVIDELGSEQMSNWVKEVVHRLIIPRYNRNLPTIFTTNYFDESLLDRGISEYSKGKLVMPIVEGETLADRIGTRLQSKLKEMCIIVPIFTRDYRNNFAESVAMPNEKTSELYRIIAQLCQQFHKLTKKSREAYYLEAYRYHHEIADHYPDALAIFLFGRARKKIPPTVPVRQFIKIVQQVNATPGEES